MMYVCVCVCMEGKIWKDKEKGNEITADSSWWNLNISQFLGQQGKKITL